MLKLAVKHLINELAINTLFDKVSSHFGNPVDAKIIRADKIEVKHLGFIKHYYDSCGIWSEKMPHPYDSMYDVYCMSLYSIDELAHERNISVELAKKMHGSYRYFVKIYLRTSDKKLMSFYSSVYQDAWIVK